MQAFLIPMMLLAAPQVGATPSADGTIIIYRGSSVYGAAIACPVRYKEATVVELGRSKFAQWSVKPGRYVLTNKTASVEVTVQPGETRYVRCQIKTGFLSGRSDLQIVDAESFNKGKADFEQKPSVAPIE